VVVVVVVVVGGAGKKKLCPVVVVVLPDGRDVEVLEVVWVTMSGKPTVSGDVTTLGAVVGVVFLSLIVAGTAPEMTVLVVVETVDGGGSTGSCAPEVVVT